MEEEVCEGVVEEVVPGWKEEGRGFATLPVKFETRSITEMNQMHTSGG